MNPDRTETAETSASSTMQKKGETLSQKDRSELLEQVSADLQGEVDTAAKSLLFVGWYSRKNSICVATEHLFRALVLAPKSEIVSLAWRVHMAESGCHDEALAESERFTEILIELGITGQPGWETAAFESRQSRGLAPRYTQGRNPLDQLEGIEKAQHRNRRAIDSIEKSRKAVDDELKRIKTPDDLKNSPLLNTQFGQRKSSSEPKRTETMMKSRFVLFDEQAAPRIHSLVNLIHRRVLSSGVPTKLRGAEWLLERKIGLAISRKYSPFDLRHAPSRRQ